MREAVVARKRKKSCLTEMCQFFCACFFITRPNCALDRHTIFCLYAPGFQRQVFKDVIILSERSKEMNEQKKNKGSVLVAESAYNSQNAQFGLVMFGALKIGACFSIW